MTRPQNISTLLYFMVFFLLLFLPVGGFSHNNDDSFISIAIISFDVSGTKYIKKKQIESILSAKLSKYDNLILLDRKKAKDSLDELHLSAGGFVNSVQRHKLGNILPADILISGSALDINNNIYLSANMTNIETGEVTGISIISNTFDIPNGITLLSKAIHNKIFSRKETINDRLESPVKKGEPIHRDKKNGKKTTVLIYISEYYESETTPVRVCESEFTGILLENDYKVIDNGKYEKRVKNYPAEDSGIFVRKLKEDKIDILITGEGFSYYFGEKAGMISATARLEITGFLVSDGTIIFSGKTATAGVDISSVSAAKNAFQNAAQKLCYDFMKQVNKFRATTRE